MTTPVAHGSGTASRNHRTATLRKRARSAVARSAAVDRVLAVVIGLVLLTAGILVGLTWAARSLRPEQRPDVVLDGGPDTAIVVSSSAAADAVAAQAAGLPGVGRARARMVGTNEAPALRITLWLADDADVREVLARLDDEVLAAARTSLGLAELPVAVRLQLDPSGAPPRVS